MDQKKLWAEDFQGDLETVEKGKGLRKKKIWTSLMFLGNLSNGHGIPGSSESDPVVLLVGLKVAENAEKFPLLQVQHC